MTKDETLKMALEALEGELLKMLDKPEDEQYRVRYAYLLRVITALREALAQPVQSLDDLVAEFESTPAGTESMRQGREWLKDLQAAQSRPRHKGEHMSIKEIIQQLRVTMDDAKGQDSHFDSWLTQNEGICKAIDALKIIDTQPVAQRQWQGLTEQDMPSGEDPMFDHRYFIAGMVYAAKVLQEKNT